MIKNIFLIAIILSVCLPAYGVDSILVRVMECSLRISGVTEKTTVDNIISRVKPERYRSLYLKVCRGPWFWQEKIVCEDEEAFIQNIVKKHGSEVFELWESDLSAETFNPRYQKASRAEIVTISSRREKWALKVAIEE